MYGGHALLGSVVQGGEMGHVWEACSVGGPGTSRTGNCHNVRAIRRCVRFMHDNTVTAQSQGCASLTVHSRLLPSIVYVLARADCLC